jgi:hypothetical protein
MSRDRSKGADVPIPSHDEIARRAYEISLQRGSQPGHELDDWLSAEKELQVQRAVVIEAQPSPRVRGRARGREASA